MSDFFNPNTKCVICDKITGLSKNKTKLGTICSECMMKLAKQNISIFSIKKYTVEELKELLNNSNLSNSQNISDKNSINCPKCGGLNIEIIGKQKKGFSVGKAIVGGTLTGGIGTLAGFLGKDGKYDVFCKNCGYRFKIK